MAKVSRPLLSISASGAFARSLIFQSAGQKKTVKCWKSPKQPRTPSVMIRRDRYRTAVAAWNALTESTKIFWTNAAAERKITGYNLFLSLEMKKSGVGIQWDGGTAIWDNGTVVWT